MSTFQMYMIIKLDDILAVCIGLAFLLFCLSLASVITFFLIEDIDEEKEAKIKNIWLKIFKLSLPTCIFFMGLATFVPDTKQMCAIIVIPKVINAVKSNQELMNLPADIVTLGSMWVNKMKLSLSDSVKIK